MRLPELVCAGLFGIVVRPLDLLVPKNRKAWVFGALDGTRFVDNPKHLFLHAVANARVDEHFTWISRNAQVVRAMRAHGFACHHNYSLAGLWAVLRAGTLVMSTKRSDVLFFYRRRARRILDLHHGMPIKKIARDYDGRARPLRQQPLLDALWTFFGVGFRFRDVNAIASTSQFYQEVLARAFENPRVRVIGQPRTDVLLRRDPVTESKLRRDFGVNAPFLATYMPTHRKFGAGTQPAIPFGGDPIARARLREAGIQVAVKLHPEALSQLRWPDNDDGVLLDLSRRCEDPQDLLRITDCLVTDYSSCFIDFLLVDRPMIFYLYDEENYIADDNGVYFRIAERQVGPIVRTEEDLLAALLRTRAGEDAFSAQRATQLPFFHAFRDDGAAERVLDLARHDLW